MIITKYINKTIMSTVFIMILVLIGIELLIEFTNQFSDIGVGSYGWRQVLQYVPLMLPQDIYQLAPMVGLLGSLVGLSLLAGNNELLVMRASGLSLFNLFGIAFKSAILLALIMILIGEVLAPLAQHKAMVKKSAAISGGQTLLTSHGIWIRNKDNFIHIDSILPDGHLKLILRYQFDSQNRLIATSLAQEGFYDQGKWIFKDIITTNLAKDKTTSENIVEQNWDLVLSPRLLGITNVNPEQKSLPQLYQHIKYRAKNGLNVERYEFIFWQRIFHPLAIVVMILLSVPFVFTFFKSKFLGFKIVIGTVIGFSFYMVSLFIGRITLLFHLPVIITAISPTIIFTSLLYILLLKKKT